MCEILQTCENQNMHHDHQLLMFFGIAVVYFAIFCTLHRVDHFFSTFCSYAHIPDAHHVQ